MSHHVYTTKGVILKQFSAHEADRVAAVLTRDLGLVYGSARGVRKTDSRLGSALLDFSLVKISLVRGKRSWRITTVTLNRDIGSELRGRRALRAAFARVARLLLHLVKGEEKHAELYDELEAGVELLDKREESEAVDWEIFLVARMLCELGYLPRSEMPSTIEEARKNRRGLVKLINEGIKLSGLYEL